MLLSGLPLDAFQRIFSELDVWDLLMLSAACPALNSAIFRSGAVSKLNIQVPSSLVWLPTLLFKLPSLRSVYVDLCGHFPPSLRPSDSLHPFQFSSMLQELRITNVGSHFDFWEARSYGSPRSLPPRPQAYNFGQLFPHLQVFSWRGSDQVMEMSSIIRLLPSTLTSLDFSLIRSQERNECSISHLPT